MAAPPTSDLLLEPPTECTVCGGKVSRWNAQHLCKDCGASWILVRETKAENLLIVWFLAAVGLLTIAPPFIAIPHFVVATAICARMALRLRKYHRYQLVSAPEGGRPPVLPAARIERP